MLKHAIRQQSSYLSFCPLTFQTATAKGASFEWFYAGVNAGGAMGTSNVQTSLADFDPNTSYFYPAKLSQINQAV